MPLDSLLTLGRHKEPAILPLSGDWSRVNVARMSTYDTRTSAHSDVAPRLEMRLLLLDSSEFAIRRIARSLSDPDADRTSGKLCVLAPECSNPPHNNPDGLARLSEIHIGQQAVYTRAFQLIKLSNWSWQQIRIFVAIEIAGDKKSTLKYTVRHCEVWDSKVALQLERKSPQEVHQEAAALAQWHDSRLRLLETAGSSWQQGSMPKSDHCQLTLLPDLGMSGDCYFLPIVLAKREQEVKERRGRKGFFGI